jgi:phage FluMu protein Com
MAIEFHCTHCGKLVRTSSEHAGKRGRCPHCKNSVYIPTPSEDIEPLDLAPVDPDEEQEKKRLLEETKELTRTIRGDHSEVPKTAAGSIASTSDSRPPALKPDVETLVYEYVKEMAAGDLAAAESTADEIRRHPEEANDIVARLMQDELMPRQISEVPKPVVIGFLKQLKL